MIYLQVDEKGQVVFQHHMPFDETFGLRKSEEDLLKEGYLVDALPQKEERPGKNAILQFNKDTESFYYEYEDLPEDHSLSTEEEIVKLKQQNSELMFAVAELASANEKDKMETQLAIAELASTLTGGIQ